LACFKWVIENYPDTQDALFALDNLVETYWRAKRGKEAFDYLQLVVKAHPNSELGALAQEFTIRNYVTDGDYEGAIRVARDLLEKFPGRERNKWVEYQIGLIYELADDPTQARAAFQAFADKYPVNFQNDPGDILPSLARIKLGRSPFGEGEAPAGKAANITEVTLDNHPNPFNAQTVVSFALPKTSFVKLEVYNTLGQRVRTLVDAPMKAGKHSAIWDGRDEEGNDVASGIYLYRLEVGGDFARIRKILLLR